MIEDALIKQFAKIAEFIHNPSVDYEKAVEMITEFDLRVLAVLSYCLSKYNPRWLESDASEAYRKLLKFQENMRVEQDRLSIAELPVEVDDTLKTWYEQEKAGVPEKDRVQLTHKQRQHVELDERLEQEAAKLKPAEIAYNTGRMAVSVLELYNAKAG